MDEILKTEVIVESREIRSVAAEDVYAETSRRVSSAQLALFAILATVAMLFAGFASAYLVRRASADWQQEYLPPILRVNTIVLVASSIALELAQRARRKGELSRMKSWIAAGAALGLVFLAGQIVAWRQLAAEGVFLSTSPYSSFFYVLTGIHGLHLLGGMLALAIVVARLSRIRQSSAGADALDVCATYWHFVGGVWLFLYLLMLYY